MKKLVIFDFDGTLVDTITDVAICFNGALAACGQPGHSLKAFDNFVGGNLETVVSRMLPPAAKEDAKIIDQVKTAYRERYLASDKPNTKPYLGVMEMIAMVQSSGAKLAVHTNKGQQLTDALVAKLFPDVPFCAVVGYDDTRPSKPDPDGVIRICQAAHCTLDEAIYVGDGKTDLDTAANAGIPCVLAAWGQTKPEDITDPRVAFCAYTVAEATSWIRGELT